MIARYPFHVYMILKTIILYDDLCRLHYIPGFFYWVSSDRMQGPSPLMAIFLPTFFAAHIAIHAYTRANIICMIKSIFVVKTCNLLE